MRRHYYKQTRSRQFFRSPSQFTHAMPLGWVGESAYNDQPQFPERQARAKEIYKMSMLKNTTVVCILNFPVFVLDSCGTCYFGLSSWEKLQLTIQKLSRQAERIDSGSPHNPLKYNFGCNIRPAEPWVGYKLDAWSCRSDESGIRGTECSPGIQPQAVN